MAGKKLARNTTINGTTYEAGTIPSAEVAELITNPKAWEPEDGDSSGSSADPAGPPPMSGKGSGKEAWAEYAAAQEVDVPADATREDIVKALSDAGKPVE